MGKSKQKIKISLLKISRKITLYYKNTLTVYCITFGSSLSLLIILAQQKCFHSRLDSTIVSLSGIIDTVLFQELQTNNPSIAMQMLFLKY